MPPAPPRPLPTAFPITIKPLLERANAGDPEALEKLKHVFDDYPGLIAELGNLAKVAEASALTLLDGGNPLLKEAARRYLATLRAELSDPAPSALERLLIDRVVISWLAVYADDLTLQRQLRAGPKAAAEAQAAARHIESSQRRLCGAVRTLAQLRKLVARPRSPLAALLNDVPETPPTHPAGSARGRTARLRDDKAQDTTPARTLIAN